MYYPSSENEGADQLRSYCEADLRLCFRLCRLLVFPCGRSINNMRSRPCFSMHKNKGFFCTMQLSHASAEGLKVHLYLSSDDKICFKSLMEFDINPKA